MSVEAGIEEVAEVTDEIVDAFARLLPQLSKSAPPLERVELDEIASSPATKLLVARVDDEIVGALTLVLFRIPTGMRAWIEDVVVDESVRGRRIGDQLTRRAIEIAQQAGARSVDLTSRPSREAANKLYQRIGFQQRDTNVYRYSE